MAFVAPRIVNDLPYVSTVNHEIHFAWQAQYLDAAGFANELGTLAQLVTA